MHKNDDSSVGEEKIKKLAEMLAKSKGAAKIEKLSAEQWEYLLKLMDEDTVNDFALIANEEKEMNEDVIREVKRKKEINKTKLFQRQEKLKVQAEQFASVQTNQENHG
jgi:hypothetical protein